MADTKKREGILYSFVSLCLCVGYNLPHSSRKFWAGYPALRCVAGLHYSPQRVNVFTTMPYHPFSFLRFPVSCTLPCILLYILIFLPALIPLSSGGEEPAKQQIQQWIQQLGDDSFLVRERAEMLLVQSGIQATSRKLVRSEKFRISWKAGCLETCTSGLGLGARRNSLPYTTCLGERIGDLETFCRKVRACQDARNASEKGVDWQFTTKDARIKLKRLYPQF